MRFLITSILATFWISLFPRPASAQILAMDSASDAAYAANPTDGAWQGEYPGNDQAGQNPPGMDNGGTGFLPWSFSGGYDDGSGPYGMFNHFIDGVDFPTTAFNNLGAPSFALGNTPLAYNGMTAVAERPFAQPLAVGDVFSAEIDTPAFYEDYYENEPDPSGGFPFAIIGFKDENGADAFFIEAGSSDEFGDFNWRYGDLNVRNGDFGADAGGSSIAPTATSDGATFSLEVLTPTTGRFTFDGVSLEITFGDLNSGMPAGPPAAVFFTLFDNNAEDDTMGNPTGEHAFYFDNLKIERPEEGIPGDFNNDGKVDVADYVVWRKTDGAPEGYMEWRTNFGRTAGAGAALSGGAAVPEPSAIIQFLIAISLLLRWRNCRVPSAPSGI
jgi:hypothetical protein